MSEKTSEEEVPWILTNQSAGVFLSVGLLGLLASVYWSEWAFEVQPDGFILGFFPFLGILWMLFCTLMLVVDHFRNETFGDVDEMGLSSWGWVTGLILGWFGYIVAVIQVGFIVTTLIYMSVILRLAGIRAWRSIAITSAVCVAVVFTLFFVIGITLPMGKLWS